MQVRFGHRHISSASCWKSSSLKCRVVLPQDISSLPCNEEFDLIPEGFLHKSCWLPYFMPPCLEHDTLALMLLLICCLFVLFLSGLSTPPSGNHCPFPIIFPHSTSVLRLPRVRREIAPWVVTYWVFQVSKQDYTYTFARQEQCSCSSS